MNLIFMLSVCFKGIGAVLEIVTQVILTRYTGLEGYGTYTTWINFADLLFWCFFSGIVKCNTFYLSGGGKRFSRFRKRYYIRYAGPVLLVIAIAAAAAGELSYAIVPLVALLELRVYDKSSSLLAEGRYVPSLLGEYILGRAVMLGGIVLLEAAGKMSLSRLLILYVIQYLAVIIYFSFHVLGKQFRKTDQPENKVRCQTIREISDQVSLRKWWEYQRGDIIQSLVGQVPVILQYFFAGALEAGVIAVVLLVKKLINFISGPTSKVFLPEFSKLYHAGEKDKLRECFASIMKVQLLFVSPLAVVLLGYPKIILGILASELIPYTNLFMMCSAVFLLAAMLGPCGGLLQMTENEKKDNRCREISIVLMFLVFVLYRDHPLFAVYGLSIQTLTESVSKYVLVCKWLGKPPVSVGTFISWWVIPALAILAAVILKSQTSFWMMAVMAGGTFLIQLYHEFRHQNLKEILDGRRKKE